MLEALDIFLILIVLGVLFWSFLQEYTKETLAGLGATASHLRPPKHHGWHPWQWNWKLEAFETR